MTNGADRSAARAGEDAETSDQNRRILTRMLEHHGLAAFAWRSGSVVWANPVALDLVYRPDVPTPADELLGRFDSAIEFPDDLASLTPGEERTAMCRLAADRALLEVSVLAVGASDRGGPLVFASFRAPMELSVDPAHVARLEAMLDSTSDIITVIDGTGTIRFSNPAAGRLTGLAGSEANGTTMLGFVHPEDVDAVTIAFTRGVVEGEPIAPIDLRIRMADGEWHHTEARLSGTVAVDGVEGHVITIRDITDRVLREQENLSHRRRLESIVENIDDVIVILGPDLAVKWTSPGIEQFVDAPAYTNVGESAFNDMHPDDVDGVVAAIGTAMERPDGRATTPLRLRHARHGWRWIEAVVVNRLDDPAVEGLVCTMRDVTAERDRDAELERLHRKDREEVASLREADVLKDRFLATVSHELRTPLASVRGFSGLLEDQWEALDPDTRSDLVERISANAQSMERLIEQLLDFSRLQAGAVEIDIAPLAIEPAIRSMIDGLAHHLEGRQVSVEVEDLSVFADRDAFDHVLRNLLTNAARYSAADSPIEVTAERDGDEIRIHVSDRGIGIAEEDQNRVFQSFFQSAPGMSHRRGAGIGLNIARRYAQLQSGHLTLESEPGVGSTFTFSLPAAVDPD